MALTILELLKLLGALALFLFGMKMMSEALQKLAGSRAKVILSSITKNRFLALLTGLLVTAVLQSSSATTVMVVSFVNAGLLSVADSIGVIMGANIGTTITGWIISALGFSVDLTLFALPAIGFALPLVFSKRNRRHSWGEFVLGIALFFMALGFLKQLIPPVDERPEFYVFLSEVANMRYLSVLIFVAVGAVLTVLVQSSSAILTLTIVLCSSGWLPYEMGAAMIMGENLGTTITANLAATVGNVSARRAALVHFVFNFLGVVWVFAVFYHFTAIVSEVAGYFSNSEAAHTALSLALFHTAFNLVNALVFIWFTKYIERIVMRLKPVGASEEEEFHLRFITTGLLSTSELSLLQVRKELSFFANHTGKMFAQVRSLIFDLKTSSQFDSSLGVIEKYESISDDVEVEIANYLTRVNQGKLSDAGRSQNRAMLRMVNELESIADSNYRIARFASKIRQMNKHLTPQVKEKAQLMFSMVEDALALMNKNIDAGFGQADLVKAQECEQQINMYRDQMKMEHLDNIRNNVYSYEVGVCFMDIMLECERLADCIINVSEALSDGFSMGEA